MLENMNRNNNEVLWEMKYSVGNRIENLEITTDTYGQLIFNQDAKSI